ncbi:hypothetical protein JW977_00405 [Candidatus Falkowbacteria bacterium]|nr:hypothetical protein [Candidatus Falkowbacteria bacterium]
MDTSQIIILFIAHLATIGLLVYVAYAGLYKWILAYRKVYWWEYIIVLIWCMICSNIMALIYDFYWSIFFLIFYSVILVLGFKLLGKRQIAKQQKIDSYLNLSIQSVILIIFAIIVVNGAYNDGKIFNKRQHELKTKLREVKDLKSALTEKISEVKQLNSEYSVSINELKDEIIREKDAKSIKSFNQAIENQRINYDLALIQRKKAYIVKLEEILARLNEGVIELEYVQRQSEDDVRLVQVLKDEEAKKIIEGINDVVAKYLPDAAKLEINIDPEEMQTPQQIWGEIVQTENKSNPEGEVQEGESVSDPNIKPDDNETTTQDNNQNDNAGQKGTDIAPNGDMIRSFDRE